MRWWTKRSLERPARIYVLLSTLISILSTRLAVLQRLHTYTLSLSLSLLFCLCRIRGFTLWAGSSTGVVNPNGVPVQVHVSEMHTGVRRR